MLWLVNGVVGDSHPSGISATVTVQVVAQPVHYVAADSGNPVSPYTSWATAARNIQDAVDAATGDEIVVSNGTYATGCAGGKVGTSTLTCRVAVDKPLTVRSVNGPQFTMILGSKAPGIRCVYLTNAASLSGFTLTNGVGQAGGGVWCQSATAVVSNCVLTGNGYTLSGDGGGAYQGTLNKCTLTGNSAAFGGGVYQSTLNNCTLSGNSALAGGGAYLSTLNNCTLSGNSAGLGGGAYQSTLKNCTLSGNAASSSGGGAIYGTLKNCTLTDNSGGGATGNEVRACTLDNCIVYYNTPYNTGFYTVLFYSCTTPLPNGGAGNITNAPLMVDAGGGNLRLQSNSPCINAGNNAYVSGSTDLDGRPRIVDGIVDMGAYEFQGPGLSEFIGWLQQYSLPTDGLADYTDSDSDVLNSWQEWIAGTDPTNALSVLRMLTPVSGVPGVIVSWQSVSGRNYFLERGTNLGLQPPFLLLQSNLTGQAGTTSYTDTNAVGPGPFFYRVGVED